MLADRFSFIEHWCGSNIVHWAVPTTYASRPDMRARCETAVREAITGLRPEGCGFAMVVIQYVPFCTALPFFSYAVHSGGIHKSRSDRKPHLMVRLMRLNGSVYGTLHVPFLKVSIHTVLSFRSNPPLRCSVAKGVFAVKKTKMWHYGRYTCRYAK